MISTVLDPRDVRDIAPLMLDSQGRLKVVEASVLTQTTRNERALFGVRHGLYSFPTTELVAFLRTLIADRTAIEIGAGHGQLAQALGIPATDSRQQEELTIKAYYEALRQPTVPYGNHVEKLDALQAIARYRPQVVIGCWVTHRYRPDRHEAGGNQDGIDEEAVLAGCETYVVVGNEKVHASKSLWGSHAFEKLTPEWLFSRAVNGSPEFIAIWQNPARTTK